MNYFSNLNSKKVFQYFEEISKIPRCSGNERAVSDYLVLFSKARNLEYYQDDIFNIIIKKPASTGYEKAPSIALQGHLDMVCEKNRDKLHDFDNDPINLVVADGMISADGTTLGADNGIAVAIAMAILDSSDIKHPRIEVILTVQEETGLTGAKHLNPDKIDSRFLINIDSEEEGKFLSSCAGGLRSKIELPVEWTSLETEYETYKISVTGLLGGHSGMQIDLGRGNAICILGRILNDFQRFLKYEIFEISGGSKDNVIPREAFSVIAIKAGTSGILNTLIADWNSILNKEYALKENNILIMLEKIDNSSSDVLNSKSKQNLLFILNLHPNGINTMSAYIPGLVESSISLGVLSTDEHHIYFSSAIRSSIKSIKHDIAHKLRLLSAQ
ncbi:MAG: beta-Ala-His dipeptidase, partial [Proteocatella sp.]